MLKKWLWLGVVIAPLSGCDKSDEVKPLTGAKETAQTRSKEVMAKEEVAKVEKSAQRFLKDVDYRAAKKYIGGKLEVYEQREKIRAMQKDATTPESKAQLEEIRRNVNAVWNDLGQPRHTLEDMAKGPGAPEIILCILKIDDHLTRVDAYQEELEALGESVAELRRGADKMDDAEFAKAAEQKLARVKEIGKRSKEEQDLMAKAIDELGELKKAYKESND